MNKVIFFYPSFQNSDSTAKPLYTDLPLSVVTLAAQMRPDEYEVKIIDERLNKLSDNEIFIQLQNVFIVGISATTSYQIINGLAFAEKVRLYNKDIKIIWGGWHPSLIPFETIRHNLVDIVVMGQGEYIIPQLADCIKNNQSLQNMPNIIYKNKNGDIIKTIEKRYNDLQLVNNIIKGYPYLNMEKYIHSQWGNKRVLGYESSRGCCFACKFCSIGSVFKRKWYGMDSEDIYRDIQWLKKNHQIDAVHFFDNNFFINKERAIQLARLFENNQLNIKWDGTVVVSQFLNFTQREIDALKRGGLFRVIAGIESGDENVLQHIHKKHTNTQVMEFVKRCKDHDIMPSLSFMVGFPWDPGKDTENTFRLVEQIKSLHGKTEILLFIFSPYLGTPLYEVAKQSGMIFPNSLKGWSEFTYEKVNTPWVSEKLCKKIDRYLKFLGTKTLSEQENNFFMSFE